MIDSPYLVKSGKRIRLSKIPTDDTGRFKDKQAGRDATESNLHTLDDRQEVLYAQSKYALLIVLQAMDAAGKDGTIESIFSGVNPQGCQVTSFKAPSHLELAHDYLWRVHNACPARGMIGIFNRSHYEDVLVARVKKLVPKSVWSKRYDHINDFERTLADEGTTIIKFYLHISKEEQNERMKARLADRTKRWKFNPADIIEGKRWDDYMAAYEDALSACSTKHAPWYVVPADHKWYRNWVVSDIIVRTIKKMDLKYPDEIEGLDQIKL
ncbi:MAG: polyphosphate kinase 2 family protein [Anaerolineae bacterium]|nr:polyphosphate kinase 2 family protein [Phycisphaerae bacterium]